MPEPHDGPSEVVERVQQRVDALADLPVAEHPAAYEQVDELLQDALARLDEG